MLSKKKIYTILFSLTVFICLFGFIWSYVVTSDIRKSQKAGAVDADIKRQVISVKNLVLTETKDERIYWELYAKKGNYDSKTGDVVLEQATGNFYNSDNEVVLSYESDLGTYSEKTKKIVLEGNVLVVAKDTSSIKADTISFTGKEDDIIAKGNVFVKRGKDFTATSESARFNSDLTFFEISGNTVTKVYSDDESFETGLMK